MKDQTKQYVEITLVAGNYTVSNPSLIKPYHAADSVIFNGYLMSTKHIFEVGKELPFRDTPCIASRCATYKVFMLCAVEDIAECKKALAAKLLTIHQKGYEELSKSLDELSQAMSNLVSNS